MTPKWKVASIITCHERTSHSNFCLRCATLSADTLTHFTLTPAPAMTTPTTNVTRPQRRVQPMTPCQLSRHRRRWQTVVKLSNSSSRWRRHHALRPLKILYAIDTVATMANGCPIWRSRIYMVLRVFN